MDERGANIDLLFRNGLRDYEVLPPQDTWDKIKPAVGKNRWLIYLRTAAAVAVITSLGYLTGMLTRDVPSENLYSYAILDIPVSQPVILAESVKESGQSSLPAFTPANNIIVPDRAEYNHEIVLSGSNPVYREIISRQPRDVSSLNDIITVPEKADIKQVGKIQIGNPINDITGDFSGTRFTGRKWSVSAMASPTYYSKMGKGNEDYLRMAATENAGSSFAGGLGFSYKISKRISIQTGVYYSAYGQEIGGVSSFSGFSEYGAKGHSNFEVVTSNGPVQINNGDAFLISNASVDKVMTAFTNDVFDPYKAKLSYVTNSLVQNFSYIQMPVMLRYKLVDRTLDLNLLGGISYDLLIGNTAFAKTDAGKYQIGLTEGLNSLLFSSSVGMGFEYNFSEKVSLNLEPTLRYYLNPFNNLVGTRVHPYSVGVFSGFSYKF